MHLQGFDIVILLGTAFRSAVDATHERLTTTGHADARPIHGFALQAIGPEGATISELGRALGVSKQAAAKTATALEGAGYVTRAPHPDDARAIRLVRTDRGADLLRQSAVAFNEVIDVWRNTIGDEAVDALASSLHQVTGQTRLGDFPGWLG